jgi:hypothetical protein
MSVIKVLTDSALKALRPKDYLPEGILEMVRYFRDYEPINFEIRKESEGLVARSTNFRFGNIITSGRDAKELDRNIRDAIITSFEIPSAYSEKARVHRVGSERGEYAAA